MDTLLTDLHTWGAKVGAVLGALDPAEWALIGVSVYGAGLVTLAVDRRRRPRLRDLGRAGLVLVAGGGMIATGWWLRGRGYEPLGGLGGRLLHEAAALPAGWDSIGRGLLGGLTVGLEWLLVLAILIGTGLAAVAVLCALPGLLLALLTLPFIALGGLTGGGWGIIKNWLQRFLGGARGGGPPEAEPRPPAAEPRPPPSPSPSPFGSLLNGLFGESVRDHERRAALHAIRTKVYQAQKAEWEASHGLARTGTQLTREDALKDLDHQRKKAEAESKLAQEEAEKKLVEKRDALKRAELDAKIAEETVKVLKAKNEARQWEAAAGAGAGADEVSPRVREIREALKRYMTDIRTLAIDKKAILAQIEADVASGVLDAETAGAMRDQIEDLIRQHCSEP